LLETDEAYHIVLVKEKQQPQARPLKEVADKVEGKVFRQKAEELHRNWIASLKKKSFINIFE